MGLTVDKLWLVYRYGTVRHGVEQSRGGMWVEGASALGLRVGVARRASDTCDRNGRDNKTVS